MAGANGEECAEQEMFEKGQIDAIVLRGNEWRVRGGYLKMAAPGGSEGRERGAAGTTASNSEARMGEGT